MDIRCRKTQCLHNYKYTCKAKDIKITNGIDCDTFVPTNEKMPDTSKSIFKKAPNYAPTRDSKTLCINCEAQCIFNDENNPKRKNKINTCTANGITINSINEKPLCMTYCKK